MRYHNITTDDMLNGEGLRTVLWTAGCGHQCKGCQNPVTWDPEGGLLFDEAAETELFAKLGKDYNEFLCAHVKATRTEQRQRDGAR